MHERVSIQQNKGEEMRKRNKKPSHPAKASGMEKLFDKYRRSGKDRPELTFLVKGGLEEEQRLICIPASELEPTKTRLRA